MSYGSAQAEAAHLARCAAVRRIADEHFRSFAQPPPPRPLTSTSGAFTSSFVLDRVQASLSGSVAAPADGGGGEELAQLAIVDAIASSVAGCITLVSTSALTVAAGATLAGGSITLLVDAVWTVTGAICVPVSGSMSIGDAPTLDSPVTGVGAGLVTAVVTSRVGRAFPPFPRATSNKPLVEVGSWVRESGFSIVVRGLDPEDRRA